MNICYVSTVHCSGQRGGVERVTDVLSKELLKKGHNVYQISLHPAIGEDKIYNYQYFLPNKNITGAENQKFLKDIFKEKDINIIVNQSEVQEIFALLKKTHNKIPIISCIHSDPLAAIKSVDDNWDLWKIKEGVCWFTLKSPYYIARYLYQKYSRKKYYKSKYNELYNGSDIIVLLSDRYKKPFCKIAGITDESKLHTIGNPNSFDTCNKVAVNNKEKIVLFVARLDFFPKRCDRILNIWKKVEDKIPEWQLMILGDGPDKEMFQKLKERLKLQRVTFTGTVDPRPYYEKTAISCITSTHEGFPLAAIESMQYGAVPVAFGSYEAINDIIEDKKNGFIIEPFNTDKFSQTILKLINTPSLLQKMQDNISQQNNKFDKNTIVGKWEKLFNSFCK